MMQTLMRPVGLAPSLRQEERKDGRRSPERAQGRAPALRWVQPCRGSPARQEASRPAPAARAVAPPPLPPGAWSTHSGPQAQVFLALLSCLQRFLSCNGSTDQYVLSGRLYEM